MRIRPGDVTSAEVRDLLGTYFAFRSQSFPEPDREYAVRFPDPADFTGTEGVFLVVEDDAGTVVGSGGIRLLPAPEGGGVRYEVKNVWLNPSTRGRGWATDLLNELESRARAFGATELVLDTHHTLEAAGRLYARLGFEPIPPYNDNANATRWYRKPL